MKKSLLLLLFIPLHAIAQNITTVAGNGGHGYSSIGSDAATANGLFSPFGVALDNSGNLYIADGGNGLIRKVDSTGIITTIAGGAYILRIPAGDGDGGPATAAWLSYPRGVAIDHSGNIFIAAMSNNCIRKVNDSGIISTFAGINTSPYSGYTGYNGDDIPATAALLYNPMCVVFDSSGNLYIADAGNNRIRKVDTSGIITTVAGNGTEGYGGDGGPATAAQLYTPYSVAVDNSGNIYIADTYNNRIRKVSASGIISTIAGIGSGSVVGGFSGDGGAATDASLYYPMGVALDSAGNIYITDEINNRIREVSTLGIITTIAGNGTEGFSGDGGAATAAELFDPSSITVDNYGVIYFSDRENSRIRKIGPGCLAPVLGPLTGSDTVSLDSAILLTEILSGGSWSSSDTSIAVVSSGVVTGKMTGADTIKYALPSDCGTITVEKIIYVISGNAAADAGNINMPMQNVTVYPNPASTVLSVSAAVKITSITITNPVGQIVCSQAYNAEKVQIGVERLPAGIYFVRVNGSVLRKFVKE